MIQFDEDPEEEDDEEDDEEEEEKKKSAEVKAEAQPSPPYSVSLLGHVAEKKEENLFELVTFSSDSEGDTDGELSMWKSNKTT